MKVTLFNALMLATFASYGQIEVKGVNTQKSVLVDRTKQGITFQAELKYVGTDTDTLYTLMFQNARYSHISDLHTITFYGNGNTFNKLYALCMTVFAPENRKNKDYKVALKLGESDVMLSTFRMIGITTIMISADSAYCQLTESQLNNLFGK